MEIKDKEIYETPATTVLEVKAEGLICGSTTLNLNYEEEDL